MPAAPGDRTEGLQRYLAAHGIEDDIGAMTAGQRLERVAPIRFGVVDGFIGAEAGCEIALVRRRRGGDDLRAQKFSKLNGGDTDATRGAQHQQRFTFAQVGALAEGI